LAASELIRRLGQALPPERFFVIKESNELIFFSISLTRGIGSELGVICVLAAIFFSGNSPSAAVDR
jgi:hypothetical protein